MKKKPFSELVIGLACIALGVAVFIAAGSLQQVKLGIGPAGMPRFVAVAARTLTLFSPFITSFLSEHIFFSTPVALEAESAKT